MLLQVIGTGKKRLPAASVGIANVTPWAAQRADATIRFY